MRDGGSMSRSSTARLVVKAVRSSPAAGVVQRAVAAARTVHAPAGRGLTREQALAALTARPLPIEVLEPGARAGADEGMLWVGMLVLFVALVVFGSPWRRASPRRSPRA